LGRTYTCRPMRIAVVGAGGIGGLYGALLARAGHDVSFLARGPHLSAIQQHGLQVQSAEFGTFSIQARASDDARELGQADLVLFAVKTYDLDEAAQAARLLLAPDGSLVTFQNGVDAPDQVAAIVGAQHVLIGTTRLETTVLEPGVIGHLSAGHQVSVSAFDGPSTPRVVETVATLRAAQINATAVEDGRLALWDKASMLVPMATLTSVCRSAIGPIRDLPETRAMAQAMLDEFAAVASAYGYDLSAIQSRTQLGVQSAPPTMKASLARDFERGKQTELDALTGAIVRLAEARHVPVPTMRTAYAILKLREQLETATSAGAAGVAEGVGIAADRR
jgi:2-dehydropantoate 2-reductase